MERCGRVSGSSITSRLLPALRATIHSRPGVVLAVCGTGCAGSGPLSGAPVCEKLLPPIAGRPGEVIVRAVGEAPFPFVLATEELFPVTRTTSGRKTKYI